jgi:hypothetical protein
VRFIPNIPQFGSGGGPPPPPPTSQDRFAPKYLVGNVPAGDSAVPYNTGGFRYIPDINGDGTGIETALAAAAATGGDVWIRPGTYEFKLAGSPVTPLTIPAGVRVQGVGSSGAPNFGTILITKNGLDEDQALFSMQAFSQLRDVWIDAPRRSEGEGGGTLDYVVLVTGSGAKIENVTILSGMDISPASSLRYPLQIDLAQDGPDVSLENVLLANRSKQSDTPLDSAMLLLKRGSVSARNLFIFGGGRGVEVANAAEQQQGTRICKFFATDIAVRSPAQFGVYYHEVAPENQLPGTIKLHRAQVSDFQDDGKIAILLDGGEDHTISDSIVSSNFSNGSTAVELTGNCTGVTITGCAIASRSIGVRLLPNEGDAIERVSITDCNIDVDGAFYERIGIQIQRASEVTVTSNVVSVKGNLAEGNLIPTRAIYLAAANSVIIGNNVIRTSIARSASDVAVLIDGQGDADVNRVTISDNDIETSASYAIRAQDSQFSKWLVIADNDVKTFTDNENLPPINAIFSSAERTTVTGNVVDHGSLDDSAPSGVAINVAGNRCTVSGNTVEMNPQSNDPAIAIQGAYTACTGNAIGLSGQYATAAILLTNTSSNCTAVGNTCGTTTPVQDDGATNEVAHNT